MLNIIMVFFRGQKIKKFIQNNWGIILSILVILGTFWFINSLNNEIIDKNKTIQALKDEIQIITLNNSILQTAISEQNEKIRQLKVNVGESQALIDTAVQQAKKTELAYLDRIKLIKSTPPPNNCSDALALLVKSVNIIEE